MNSERLFVITSSWLCFRLSSVIIRSASFVRAGMLLSRAAVALAASADSATVTVSILVTSSAKASRTV